MKIILIIWIGITTMQTARFGIWAAYPLAEQGCLGISNFDCSTYNFTCNKGRCKPYKNTTVRTESICGRLVRSRNAPMQCLLQANEKVSKAYKETGPKMRWIKEKRYKYFGGYLPCILVNSSGRSNMDQVRMGKYAVHAKLGCSGHECFIDIDVQNWGQSKSALQACGFKCAHIKNDRVHCSWMDTSKR